MQTRVAEQLLIEALTEVGPCRAICTSQGRGQLAAHLADQGATEVQLPFWDIYLAEQAKEVLGEYASVEVICQSELPEGPFQLAALPCSRQGDAELTRDLMQQCYARLEPGGAFWVSVDAPGDQWVRKELGKLNPRVRRNVEPTGVVYRIIRDDKPVRLRNFDCEFKFRDGARLIDLKTRPGVFSHRRLDTGARCLIEAMEITAGDRILDVGCGSGGVGIAAALRAPDTQLTLIDVNPRALSCAEWGCLQNQVSQFELKLNAQVQIELPGSYDWVLANPPYYSNQQIARVMFEGGLAALRPAGLMLVVTKQPQWYEETFRDQVAEMEIWPWRHYAVVAVRQFDD
jgi:16S rRNA G1207 methylase RsmC